MRIQTKINLKVNLIELINFYSPWNIRNLWLSNDILGRSLGTTWKNKGRVKRFKILSKPLIYFFDFVCCQKKKKKYLQKNGFPDWGIKILVGHWEISEKIFISIKNQLLPGNLSSKIIKRNFYQGFFCFFCFLLTMWCFWFETDERQTSGRDAVLHM